MGGTCYPFRDIVILGVTWQIAQASLWNKHPEGASFTNIADTSDTTCLEHMIYHHSVALLLSQIRRPSSPGLAKS